MSELANEPVLTDVYEKAHNFLPVAGSIYVYRQSNEERSGHVKSWRGGTSGVKFVEVYEEAESEFWALDNVAVNSAIDGRVAPFADA